MAFQEVCMFFLLVALASTHLTAAYDPSPVQDFCVADNTGQVFVNGFACKNPALVTDNDFFFSGLHRPGDTMNKLGSKVTPVNVAQIPGLNTMGVAMARLDIEPMGVNPPHTHPRGTEIITVLEGTLGVGFVTSNLANGSNRLISRILNKGDVFVFPIGLVHFQINIGQTKAVAIAAFSSQNPGTITVANALFGSQPEIDVNVLAKAFQLDRKIIEYLQRQF